MSFGGGRLLLSTRNLVPSVLAAIYDNVKRGGSEGGERLSRIPSTSSGPAIAKCLEQCVRIATCLRPFGSPLPAGNISTP